MGENILEIILCSYLEINTTCIFTPPQDGRPLERPILTDRLMNHWRGKGLVRAYAN